MLTDGGIILRSSSTAPAVTAVDSHLDAFFQDMTAGLSWRPHVHTQPLCEADALTVPRVLDFCTTDPSKDRPTLGISMEEANHNIRNIFLPSPSQKQEFLGILRGTGLGKTRIAEHHRLAGLQLDDTFPLAATFGYPSELDASELASYHDRLKARLGIEPSTSIACAVIARLAFDFFDVRTFREMRNRLITSISCLGSLASYDVIGERLLRCFLWFIVQALNSRPNKKSVTKVLVILDETVRAQRVGAVLFARRDILSTVRDAVAERFDGTLQNDGFQSQLLVTGLNLIAFGSTLSGSRVRAIKVREWSVDEMYPTHNLRWLTMH